MMPSFGRRAIGIGLGGVVLLGCLAGTINTVGNAVRRQALKSNDLTTIRKEALTMFPRGSRLKDAAENLADIGFSCEPMRHQLADISGPALLCASQGRGYPDYPAINVTVSTRNGLVSEIEVWNIMAKSDDDTSLISLTGAESSSPVRTASIDPDP